MNPLTLIANIRHFKHEQEITKVNIIMYYLWTLEIGHRVIKSDLQSSKSSRSCESFFGAAEAAACLDLADGFFTGTSSSELDSSKIQRRQHIHTVKIPANEISAFTFTFFTYFNVLSVRLTPAKMCLLSVVTYYALHISPVDPDTNIGNWNMLVRLPIIKVLILTSKYSKEQGIPCFKVP